MFKYQGLDIQYIQKNDLVVYFELPLLDAGFDLYDKKHKDYFK